MIECLSTRACCLPCSADSLEEAPTEAGFHLDGDTEKVLSKLGDEQQQLRRYSRSFSEPNLAAHFLQEVQVHPNCVITSCMPWMCAETMHGVQTVRLPYSSG